MIRGIAGALVLCCAVGGWYSAQGLPVSVTLTASPASALPEEQVTLTLMATNNGPDLVNPIIGLIGQDFSDASVPAGWTMKLYDNCSIYECNAPATGITAPLLRTGESVRFSVTSIVRRPPGATIQWSGFVFLRFQVFVPASATTTVRGSGPAPTGTTALAALDSTRTAASDFGSLASLSFDTINKRFLEATKERPTASTAQLAVGLITSSGMPTTPMLLPEPPTSDYPTSVRSAYNADVRLGAETGGYLLSWGSNTSYAVYCYAISSSGLLKSSRGTLFTATGVPKMGSIAYSPASRLFMVAFADCASSVSTDCHSYVRRVGLDGQPVGSTIDIGAGLRPKVVWNPISNEFGVVRVALSAGSQTIELARVSTTGDLLGRTTVEKYVNSGTAEIDVNGRSGPYVIVWDDGQVFGAELRPDGRLTSQGLVSADMRMRDYEDSQPLSYNPISDTFLVLGQASGPSNRAVELNQFGAPLSPTAPQIDSFFQYGKVVASRSDAAEWRVLGTQAAPNICCTFFQTTTGITTSTGSSGSTMRLGGCTSPDPFEAMGGGICFDGGWLPPGVYPPGTNPLPATVVPGGCTTPDPFVVLGGGRCVNGGWLPPTMSINTGCLLPDPFASVGGGRCVNGGWLPPLVISTTPPPTTSCPGVAPGAGWICLNSGWLPPTHPLAVSGGSTPPPPTSCSTPDPFTAMGGGVCINGGWIPKTNPLAGGG